MLSEDGVEPYKVEMYDKGQIMHAVGLGVNWAQEEFKKSLWHDAGEEPEENKFIIEKIFDDYEIDCTV